MAAGTPNRHSLTSPNASSESQAEWLSRLAFRMNICIWVYVVSRLLVDLTAFYSENLLASFIRTELFIDPAEIPSAALPLALTYALVDLTLNRILTSAGLCLSPFTYIVMNFVSIIDLIEDRYPANYLPRELLT